MRLVVDTNVLVSALIKPGGTPGQLLDKIVAGHIVPVYSAAILGEYEVVLARRKFSFDPHDVDALLELIAAEGWPISNIAWVDINLPDPGDRPFYECAAAARCPIVTGNLKHFPKGGPAEVLSPAQVIREMQAQP